MSRSDTETDKSLLRDQSGFFLLLAGYFLLHWLLRTFTGGGFEMDEAEQLVLGQRLQIGYSPDPPLYTWLQLPLLRLFGEGAFALALLKNLMLFGLYASVYFIGRHCGFSSQKAALASLSMLLLPGIGWESQRDLTHSVLVTLMAAVTLWAAMGLLREKAGPGRYLLLGVLFGLGVLSKWNYALFALALVISLASLRPRAVFRPAFILTLLVALGILAPFLWWIYENPAIATATSYKLEAEALPYLQRLLGGAKTLVIAYAEFAGLFLILWVALFLPWRVERKSGGSARPPAVSLLIRLFWVVLGILVVFLFVSGGTVYRSRWLMPVLFYLPVLVFYLVPDPFWVPGRIARYRRLLYGAMLVIPLGLTARVYLLPLTGDYTKPHFPGQALAEALIAEAGRQDLVVAQNHYIGGNLQPHLEGAMVSAPPVDFPLAAMRPAADAPLLLIWDRGEYQDMPATLKSYVNKRLGGTIEPIGKPGEIQVPYRFSETEYYRLGWQPVRMTR